LARFHAAWQQDGHSFRLLDGVWDLSLATLKSETVAFVAGAQQIAKHRPVAPNVFRPRLLCAGRRLLVAGTRSESNGFELPSLLALKPFVELHA
jgi:hypothetical protein